MFWKRKRNGRDFREEIQSHIDIETERLISEGFSPAEAGSAARRTFGNVTASQERFYESQRTALWLDDFARDMRHALRSLRGNPTFTAVALLTLALGIGANAAIFSIVNAVMLEPLPYSKPEQLMHLVTQYPRTPRFRVSTPEYMEFREMNRSFSSVGAYVEGEADVLGGERPRRVPMAAVDSRLLDALGIKAAQGRLFAPEETEVTGLETLTTAILSHELWQSAFGGRPMIGQTVEVDGVRREVIGIMPPGAALKDQRTDIWLPLGLNPADRQNRGSHGLFLIGRLSEGVTQQSAQMELDALIESWRERVGVTNHVFAPLDENGGHVLYMTPLQQEVVGDAGRAIWVLQAAVGLVLLIACANLANLLLARGEARHQEFAVRRALGASRGRLLRQFMTEGVVLSIGGGILGVALARAGVAALIAAYPTSLPRASEVSVNAPVLLWTFAISMATGVLFGLAPIMQTRAQPLLTALKEGGTKGATGAARQTVRRCLVIAEVALAVMLVIGAGLLLRTVLNLTKVDAGFAPSRLVTFSMRFSGAAYRDSAARVRGWQRILGEIRVIPGVESATATRGLPPNRPSNSINTDIESYSAQPGGPNEVVNYDQSVMSGYFETMGIPILAGRGFEQTDAASAARVVVVNETFAKTFTSGQNPIGQRLRRLGWYDDAWWTVIGVARDVKQGGVDRETGTELYFLAEQAERSGPLAMPTTMNVVLRTALPAPALAQTLERVVKEVDAAIPIVRLREMDEVFAESISRPRLLSQLVGAFAALALLLAAVGTYGVLAYTVAARRREIGIRMALGANRLAVLAQVMKQGFLITSAGVVIGLGGALLLTRLMAALLFGVQPTDGATLVTAIATITLVSIAACWLPAWRASQVDPIVMLRYE
jgi:putative ABC transport system permease protein